MKTGRVARRPRLWPGLHTHQWRTQGKPRTSWFRPDPKHRTDGRGRPVGFALKKKTHQFSLQGKYLDLSHCSSRALSSSVTTTGSERMCPSFSPAFAIPCLFKGLPLCATIPNNCTEHDLQNKASGNGQRSICRSARKLAGLSCNLFRPAGGLRRPFGHLRDLPGRPLSTCLDHLRMRRFTPPFQTVFAPAHCVCDSRPCSWSHSLSIHVPRHFRWLHSPRCTRAGSRFSGHTW